MNKIQGIIDKLNSILIVANQAIRVTAYTKDSISLSNNLVLAGNDKIKFYKRLTNKKHNIWAINMDKLLSKEITENEIKSKLCSIGGLSVQAKYKDIIKQNLNTGVPWNKGMSGEYNNGPMAPEVKNKISIKNTGVNNGMYGRKMSDADKQIRSDIMKSLILAGKFTPNSNNRNSHWDSKFDEKVYRSSWEALYQYINPNAEYEKLRIEYIFNNKLKIYIVDFIDRINKQVIEVKPKELCAGDKFNAKFNALIEWAKINQYSVLLADQNWLKSQNLIIDYTRFDKNTGIKIKKLYETN